MSRSELLEGWRAGDIGLAQWAALPLGFRLDLAAGGWWFELSGAVARLIHDLNWSPAEVQELLPEFEGWPEVARNPATTVAVLEELARTKGADVRAAVGLNPRTPVTLLEALAEDSTPRVRESVAQNCNSPDHILEALGKDRIVTVRRQVAKSPRTPAAVMERLAHDKDSDVRQMLASNASTPGHLLEALARDKSVQVRAAVAQNSSSPLSALQVLSTDRLAAVRMAAAKNRSCPAAVLEASSQDADVQVREAVAQNQGAPVHVLEAVFKTGGGGVNAALARNPATPTGVLSLLSAQDDPWIQAEVARHPSIPDELRQELLEALSKLPSEADRRRMAGNPATPPHLLEALSRDPKADVRCAAASNPRCPQEVLRRLSSAGSGVQEAVAGNTNTPLEVLIQLAGSKSPQVRKRLATQAHRSEELRLRLWADPDGDVRDAVASCQDLTAAMLDQLLQTCTSERGLMALLARPHLGHASAQTIVERLFRTPAVQSPWFLRELAKAGDDVQAAVTAGTFLAYFGKDPNKDVLSKRPLGAVMALSSCPSIDPARIVRVVGSTDWLVRAAVARNPATPPNLLKKLGTDAHPVVSAMARRSLAEAASPKVKGDAVCDASGPPNLDRAVAEILQRLRADGSAWAATAIVNSAAWRDQASLGEVLSWLKRFEEFDEWVQSLLDELDDARRELFWIWGASVRDAEVRMRLAEHPAAPPTALERFAADESVAVPLAVAGRDRLPEKFRSKLEKAALRALMRRGVSFRRQMAVHAAALPAFVRERLARDEYWVRESLGVTASFPDWMTRAMSPGDSAAVPGDRTVDDLGRDDRVEPRARAAVRRRLAAEWTNHLRQAFHREVLLRQGEPPAAAPTIAAADVLSALAWLGCVPASDKASPIKSSRSPDWLSRLGAAQHPGATEAILRLLAGDADPDVAAAAQLRISQLETPQAVN